MGSFGPLTTRGGDIVRADTGEPVRLRGVNRSGLEYVHPGTRGFLEASGISRDEIASIADWGCNILRVPFNQQHALEGCEGRPADEYLDALDTVIEWAASAGMWTLLDLQWLDLHTVRGRHLDGSPNRVPALPDAGSIEVWARLAARYRHRPEVLFDVFNEPHDPIRWPLLKRWSDWSPTAMLDDAGALVSSTVRDVDMHVWRPWAAHLVRTIRNVHPDALVFVSGVDWAYDLRGFPLRDGDTPMPHVVYATHVYPWSGWLLDPRRPIRALRALVSRQWRLGWDDAFGQLADTHPVFVAEWGGTARDVAWGERLARYLGERDIGWAAWSWTDWPALNTRTPHGDRVPTPFGRVVRAALDSPVRQTGPLSVRAEAGVPRDRVEG